jgi:hypothetical protein
MIENMVHTAKFTVNASVFMVRTEICFLFSVAIRYSFHSALGRLKVIAFSARPKNRDGYIKTP